MGEAHECDLDSGEIRVEEHFSNPIIQKKEGGKT